jgi:cell division inhibitor SepF
MSIWDNVKKFAQPYSDDEYDEYDDYEEEFDEVEEEPVRRAPRKSTRTSRPARRPNPVKEERVAPVEEEDEDDYESAFNALPKAAPAPAPMAAPAGFPGKVVSMNRSGNAQEIVRYHPTSFQDSKEAAKDLVASKAVIVNLDHMEDETSPRRMVDFLSGVVFAMDGDVQKVAPNVYVFCPPNVFITGGQDEVQTVAEEIM